MLNHGSGIRRQTVVAAIALAVVAVVPTLATWSTGTAAGGLAQTITFGPIADRTLNDVALVVTASASSGLGVNFKSVTTDVCSADPPNGSTISPKTTGVCTIQADQPGDATYNAAPPVQQSFTITKGAQTITFDPIPDRSLGQGAFTAVATASTGFAVTFTASPASVCTATGVHGATITPMAAGTCTVQADQAGNAIFAAAPSVTQSFGIDKAAQAITFNPLSDKTTLQTPVTVSATSSALLIVTFTTTTPTVCTAGGTNGATITLLAAGVCTVQADQAGNASISAAPSIQRSFAVTLSPQSITFGSLADRTALQSPLTVHATASSALVVTFTTTTPSVCTASGTNGTTITLISAGTCTVQADQAGNSVYAAAPPVQENFAVTQAAQTITFPGLVARTLLQTPVTAAATSSSGLTVTFTTTTPTVCTAGGTNGTSITLVGAGVCSVEADQAGNTLYSAAPAVTLSFTVTRSNQTITFTALANAPVGTPITVSATASSGLDVTFTTTTPAVCTASGVDGTTITALAAGTCSVAADQPGDTTYNAAPTVTRSFTVAKVDQTITFGPPANTPIGPTITISATASSGLDVVFTTTTPTVCTAGGTNGTTITPFAAGTCTVHADQAGDTTYNAAPTVIQSFGVGKTDQTITFGALAAVSVTHAPITVTATASSGLAVMFSTTTPSVCTAGGTNGATITIVGAGSCTVQTDQAGNDTFNLAPSVSQSFTVGKVHQTITFAALAGTQLSDSPITLRATASSHLAVTFASTATTICRTGGTNGTKLTLLKAGTCTVRAGQAGNATFNAAPAVTHSFVVKKNPTVTHDNSGYWMLGSDGQVYAFGNAHDYGSSAAPAVAFAAQAGGKGYWIVDNTGDVRAFGSAIFHGGRPSLRAGELVSTIAGTRRGNGYWLFTTLGRAFAFGDAHFFGDMSAVHLNGPVIASVATPTGRGYYMVASDGGVFSFGDARFHGSMGGAHLNQPIVGLSPTPDNHGYWLVASDGGVFAFRAPFRGSLGSVRLNRPVNGLVAFGNGYLMVAADGGVFDYSDKAFVGSLGDDPPSAPIVGIAALFTP